MTLRKDIAEKKRLREERNSRMACDWIKSEIRDMKRQAVEGKRLFEVDANGNLHHTGVVPKRWDYWPFTGVMDAMKPKWRDASDGVSEQATP